MNAVIAISSSASRGRCCALQQQDQVGMVATCCTVRRYTCSSRLLKVVCLFVPTGWTQIQKSHTGFWNSCDRQLHSPGPPCKHSDAPGANRSARSCVCACCRMCVPIGLIALCLPIRHARSVACAAGVTCTKPLGKTHAQRFRDAPPNPPHRYAQSLACRQIVAHCSADA